MDLAACWETDVYQLAMLNAFVAPPSKRWPHLANVGLRNQQINCACEGQESADLNELTEYQISVYAAGIVGRIGGVNFLRYPISEQEYWEEYDRGEQKEYDPAHSVTH